MLISSPRRTPVNKLYAIWNFLKHNNLSTYEALKNSYPEAIIEVNRKYTQGELVLFYINFDETLINTLLTELNWNVILIYRKIILWVQIPFAIRL